MKAFAKIFGKKFGSKKTVSKSIGRNAASFESPPPANQPGAAGHTRGRRSSWFSRQRQSSRNAAGAQDATGTGTAGDDQTNPVSVLDSLARKVLGFFKRIVDSVPSISLFFTALFILLAILAIFLLILVLVFYARPIVPAPCHSMDYDKYMNSDYIPDFIEALHVFGRNTRYYADRVLHGDSKHILDARTIKTSRFSKDWKDFGSVAVDVATNVQKLLARSDADLARNILLFFAHYRCFTSRMEVPYSWFCGASLSHNEEWTDTVKGGRILDQKIIKVFETDVVTPLEILRNGTRAISESIDGDITGIMESDWYRADPQQAFEWIMSAHKLRMFLNEYHKPINEAAMSRIPDKFAINTWILYYVPVVADIFKYRIPQIWREMPTKYLAMHRMYTHAWAALGDFIVNLPCTIAHTDPTERQKYCTSRPMQDAVEDEENEDTRTSSCK